MVKGIIHRMKRLSLFSILLALVLLSACSSSTPTATLTPTNTVTPMPPTPTSLPMALRVNGEGILLSDYQASLNRLIQAQTDQNITANSEEQKNQVLQNYIDQLLLAQAAIQAGYNVDDAAVQARIDLLITEIGGVDQLTSWQTAYGYTDESFKAAERLEMLAIWQRDQIINAVPVTAEQIHAQQMLFQDEANANAAYQKLQDGMNFAELALIYDPVLGGDIGWFARGGLTQPDVAAAAFALQPGEYSQVIKSSFGYHIIYVIDRETQHPLSVEARRNLQLQALTKWLEDARAASTIEILVQ